MNKKGVMYRGEFWPAYWGGVLFNSPAYGVKPKEDISPTIRSEKNDAGVCVEYEEPRGIYFKGHFCEVGGGLYAFQSPRFFHGTLPDVARAIEIGTPMCVVVEYESKETF